MCDNITCVSYEKKANQHPPTGNQHLLAGNHYPPNGNNTHLLELEDDDDLDIKYYRCVITCAYSKKDISRTIKLILPY